MDDATRRTHQALEATAAADRAYEGTSSGVLAVVVVLVYDNRNAAVAFRGDRLVADELPELFAQLSTAKRSLVVTGFRDGREGKKHG